MTAIRYFIFWFFVSVMLPRAFAEINIPPESEAWLSVHFEYPNINKKGDYYGRIGPGYELHKRKLPNVGPSKKDGVKLAALVVLFYGDKPQQGSLQYTNFSRFSSDWERIGLMKCDPAVFSKIELPPFDDRTLVVTVREDGRVTKISIYAPEFCAEKLKDRTEGKALRDALDLLHRVVGEATL